MQFGKVAVQMAQGAILAHAVTAPGGTFRKGRVLSPDDIAALQAGGVEEITVARLDQGDVPEDEAATRLAAILVGDHLRAGPAATGRVNLYAIMRGVLSLDTTLIDRINGCDEAITLATLPAFARVEPGQMVATIKIIPFAAPAEALSECLVLAGSAPVLAVAPYRVRDYHLIQTGLPGTSAKMLDKTRRVTEARVRAVAGAIRGETRCAHDAAALAEAIRTAPPGAVLLIVGAGAITDRRDVLPAAIELAGGRIEHVGMPVDPGNLLLLAEQGGRPVLGLPGCARSPKLNGFDWVLERVAAGLPVRRGDVMRMGVGGLLMEIPSRPSPREEPATGAGHPEFAALILAAGQSRRMGRNKLLIEVDGTPMVRHAARAALQAGITELVVVTGHQRERVEAALGDLPVRLVHNPAYAEGLSTSVKAGIGALPPGLEGAVVCLGDMPRITAAHVRRLIDAFDPTEDRAIVVPTHRGKRGNPVLWAASFFPAMTELRGDVGAKHLIGENADLVAEVEIEDPAPLLDIDTPEALLELQEAAA